MAGCFRKVYVNGRMMDFSSTTNNQYKIKPGCPTHDETDPCEAHMCKYGKCKVPNYSVTNAARKVHGENAIFALFSGKVYSCHRCANKYKNTPEQP